MAADANMLQAEVLTPEGKVYEGELFQVSARTVVGEIGVRARHAPVLARLVPHELRLYEDQSAFDSSGGERFAAAEGWLEVFANKVVVLVGEARKPNSLDAGTLREQISDAEARLEGSEEDSAAREAAERDLERAKAFLQIAEG
jgi:F-type H+-transporting ATPase subunit epsilon